LGRDAAAPTIGPGPPPQGNRIRPSTIADGRAEYRLERFTVFGYARDLFDTFALIERDATGAAPENPREVGLGIEASL
jgi:hypothetical protein